MDGFDSLWYDCDGHDTHTSLDQADCEKICAKCLIPISQLPREEAAMMRYEGLLSYSSDDINLLRSKHASFLLEGLSGVLPSGFASLDASRPWIIYWILHALYLLGESPTHLHGRIVSTLASMRNSRGGFGGGPEQIPHGAPNYAAVLALCTVGTVEAFGVIDRPAMYNFCLSMKDPLLGGFRMHEDGEIDTRATYTVLSIARILNILTPELSEGTAEYLASCQTYEGGFGGEPFNEAHGGYNFCALASLLILGRVHTCDLDAQEHWLLQRQMKLEGGFQGRTNKLVDSCYSFWQGAALAVVDMIRAGEGDLPNTDIETEVINGRDTKEDDNSEAATASGIEEIDLSKEPRIYCFSTEDRGSLSFNQLALQRYILRCGQQSNGGLRDKPGKSRDFYHTCYALSGLSVAQWTNRYELDCAQPSSEDKSTSDQIKLKNGIRLTRKASDSVYVYGSTGNMLEPTSPVFNIGTDKLKSAVRYFYSPGTACTHAELTKLYTEQIEQKF